jgi:hypothetical protein
MAGKIMSLRDYIPLKSYESGILESETPRRNHMSERIARGLNLAIGIVAWATLVGCAPSPPSGAEAEVSQPVAAHHVGGWWCAEHGVPEAECSQCSSQVAADFQRKGDWCKEHDRAQSQCFACDPRVKEKYAAIYRARTGDDPPPLSEHSLP